MGKAKPQRRISASSYFSQKELGPILNHTIIRPVSKKLINFLRHGSPPRDNRELLNSGEKKKIEFIYYVVIIGLTSGRAIWQEEEDERKDSRALQGHPGRNLIDLSLQDNVVIPSNFFQHIYHIGCAINLHSIINSGLILGGQNF